MRADNARSPQQKGLHALFSPLVDRSPGALQSIGKSSNPARHISGGVSRLTTARPAGSP